MELLLASDSQRKAEAPAAFTVQLICCDSHISSLDIWGSGINENAQGANSRVVKCLYGLLQDNMPGELSIPHPLHMSD